MKPISTCFLLIALIGNVCCSQESSPKAKEAPKEEKAKAPDWLTHVDVQEANKLIKSKTPPIILDIRTDFEIKSGIIPGAKTANYYAKDFEEQVAKLDKEKPIMIHCRSGGRSKESLPIFKKLGFKKVYHMDGGILAWQKAGFPIDKE